nr:hypothetical protein [Algoriphagus locisalis]
MTGSNVVIDELKNIVDELEASVWDKRSQEASSHLKDKSEEDRRMLLMSAKEKKFFLKYKAENPDNKWDYFEDYAKEVSQDFSKSLDK